MNQTSIVGHDDSVPELGCLAIATTSAPPAMSGQALVLSRVCAALGWRIVYFSDSVIPEDALRAGAAYHRTSPPTHFLVRGLDRLGKTMAGANIRLGLMRTVVRRAGEIARALRTGPPAAVVGCSGDPFDLPAAYLAARKVRAPFVAYLFDDPAYQFPAGVYRDMAKFWEPIWMRGAHSIIVTNEVMAEDVQRRHPAAALRIVRNPVGSEVASAADWRPPRSAGAPVKILYTGSVYHAQGTAFQNLVAAMRLQPGRYRLEVYTSQPPSALEANGLVGTDVVRRDPVAPDRALQLQREADVLFLPLAFRSSISEVIRSSAPGKTGEYLSSGVPVLVHAPRDAFVSKFARERGAAVVADEDSVEALATALTEISTNEQTRLSVSKGAWRAAAEFSLAKARRDFAAAIIAAGNR